MKSKVDELDIDKLVPVPVNLSKVSDVVKTMLKKMYIMLFITTDHDDNKYITNREFHKVATENFSARLAQANLASKSNIVIFIKKTY